MPKRPAAKARTAPRGAARASTADESDSTSSYPSPAAVAAPKPRARSKVAPRPKACAKQRRRPRPKLDARRPARPPSPAPSNSSGSSDSTPTSGLVSSPSSDSERGSSVLCTPTEDVGRAATSPVPPPSASRPTPPYFGSFCGIRMCFRRPSTGQEYHHAAPEHVARCWSEQLYAARVIFSSCTFARCGHNRRPSRRHLAGALSALLRKFSACAVPFCSLPGLILSWTEGARASIEGADVGRCPRHLHCAAGLSLFLCFCLVLRWSLARQSGRVLNTTVRRGGGRSVSRLQLLLSMLLLLVAPVSGMDPAPAGTAAPLPPQVHHKRSFGRAVRKASTQAYTLYKGKRVSYRDLTGQARPAAPSPLWPTAASRRLGTRQGLTMASAGRRLRLFCWNGGGYG